MKKLSKKLIASTSAMLFSTFLLFSQGISAMALHEDSPIPVEITSGKGNIGEEVNISVNIGKDAGFGSADVVLNYDSEKLECIDAKVGEALSSHNGMNVVNKDTLGRIALGYITIENFLGEGSILDATFKIKEGASGKIDLTAQIDNLTDQEGNQIATKITNGSITVVKGLKSISLDKTNISLEKGQNDSLTVTYNPDDTTDNKEVTWSSSNENIAKVENGVITAISAGKATIVAKVGEKTASCEVTVNSPLKGISIKDSLNLNKNETKQLTVVYNPEDTTDDKTVTWSSSNEDVVKVSNDGILTGIKEGQAEVTAKVGEFTSVCKVTVKEIPLESISVKEEIELEEGKSEKLEVVYNPENTTDSKKVSFSSSNEKVATVDENGVIKAIKEGSTTITIKNGDLKVTTKVTVKKADEDKKTEINNNKPNTNTKPNTNNTTNNNKPSANSGKTNTSNTIKTSDNNYLLYYLIVMGGSLSILAAITLKKKKLS